MNLREILEHIQKLPPEMFEIDIRFITEITPNENGDGSYGMGGFAVGAIATNIDTKEVILLTQEAMDKIRSLSSDDTGDKLKIKLTGKKKNKEEETFN